MVNKVFIELKNDTEKTLTIKNTIKSRIIINNTFVCALDWIDQITKFKFLLKWYNNDQQWDNNLRLNLDLV